MANITIISEYKKPSFLLHRKYDHIIYAEIMSWIIFPFHRQKMVDKVQPEVLVLVRKRNIIRHVTHILVSSGVCSGKFEARFFKSVRAFFN